MRVIHSPFYVIKQYERGIVEFFGKYEKFVGPGLHFQIPVLRLTRVRDIREHTMDIEPQPVITKDNVEINVDGLMWVRPGLKPKTYRRHSTILTIGSSRFCSWAKHSCGRNSAS